MKKIRLKSLVLITILVCTTACGDASDMVDDFDESGEYSANGDSGYCSGVVSSCSNRSTYTCSSLSGCYTSSEYNYYSDSYDRVCTGSAYGCYTFHDEDDCEDQSGCYWYD